MDTRAEQSRVRPETGFYIDDLIIDIGRQRVLRDGQEIPIAGLSFQLLLALARAAPNLLTYDQLMQSVWPGLVINIETVSQRVKLVRDALHDDPRSPRYILGIRGRGYRMIAAVTPAFEAIASARKTTTPARATSASTIDIDKSTALEPTEKPVSASVPKQPLLKRRRALAYVAAAALCMIAAAVLVKLRSPSASALSSTSDPTSIVVQPPRTIAVLPFSNFSGDAESEYFSHGLAEELLSRLASVPGLQVAARTSSFHFKNRGDTAQAIGRTLGVRHLLEGSVRKSGTRVRVTAQLSDASTGYQLWSRTFDREITDIFTIQDEIALAVVDGLNVALLEEARAALLRPVTQNPQALDLYLRARYLTQEWQLRDLNQAIELYERATRLDPSFAAAYIGLANALQNKGEFGVVQENPARTRIRALLRKALELNPQSGDAHALLSGVLLQSFDIAGAERELRLAELLNPNGEHVLHALASFHAQAGWPPDKAITYAHQWARLDPLNPWASTYVAIAIWKANEPELALSEIEKVIAAHPEYWFAHFVHTGALIDLGRHEEALASAKRVLQLNPDWGLALANLATTHALMGNVEQSRKYLQQFERRQSASWSIRARVLVAQKNYEGAVSALENAYSARDPLLIATLHSRQLLPVHGDPRFQRLVKLLGLERRVDHARGSSRGVAARQ